MSQAGRNTESSAPRKTSILLYLLRTSADLSLQPPTHECPIRAVFLHVSCEKDNEEIQMRMALVTCQLQTLSNSRFRAGIFLLTIRVRTLKIL
jgi:hypothetical protein